MTTSRHGALAHLAVRSALGVAALFGAAPAHADISPTVIPSQEQSSTNPGHCAKVEVVYARGTDESPHNSVALNGYNYTWPAPGGSTRNSPYSVWFQITRDLGNNIVSYTGANGQPVWNEREYEMLYPNDLSIPAPSRGRSDFYLYNLPYPATLSFLSDRSPSNSVQVGTTTLITHLNAEAARCPSKKFLVFGYSQGSLVVANAISKRSQMKYIYDSDTNPATPHPVPYLSSDAMDQILSVGMLADGGFNSMETMPVWNPATGTSRLEYHRGLYSGADIPVGEPWNLDNGTPEVSNGRRNKADNPLTGPVRGQLEQPPVGPAVGLRSNNWYWEPFENRIRSYCVLADPICNRSGINAGEHLNYFNNARPRRDLQIFAVRRLREEDPRWANQPQGTAHATFYDPQDSLIVP